MSEKPTYEELEQRVKELEAAEYGYKNIQKELRESEQKYRNLFENTPIEVRLWQLVRDEYGLIKNWRLVDINPAALKAWGMTRTETVGKTGDEIFPDSSATAHFMPIVQKIFEEDMPQTWESYFSATGQHLHMTSVPFGEYFICTGVDITDRKRADELLMHDLDAMTRLQQLGMLSVQEDNLEPVLTAVVETAIAISGADFGNIQMLDPASGELRIVAQRNFPTWWIEYWNSVSKDAGVCGSALECRARVIVEDVEKSPIFLDKPALDVQRKVGVRAVQSTPLLNRLGKIVGMFSTHYRIPGRPNEHALRLLDLLARQAADIIENVQTRAALRKSEQFHRDLVDTANSAIVRWIPAGEIIYINNFGSKIFGYKQDELIGKDVMILAPDKDSTGRDISSLAKDIVKNPEKYALNVNENVKKNGDRFWMIWTNKAIKDEKGNIKEILAIGNDITERKLADEKIKQNLAEKEILLKEIHHRVKNNLAVISSLISLQSDQIDEYVVKEILNICKNRIKSMALIHEKLYQTDNLSAINFNDFIISIIDELTSTYQYRTKPINIVTSDQEVLLGIDKAIPCALIVNELIANAIKYAFIGIERPELYVCFKKTDKVYTLTVKDNGIGIAEEINSISPNTLGLTLVRILTEQVKGTLQFLTDPTAGHGITVVINFEE